VDGVLYVAIGTEEYRREAIASATSLRLLSPSLSIALATDGDAAPAVFDQIVRIEERDGFRAKIVALRQSPFDRTIFLDSDTRVVAELSALFELLERFEIAAAHAPNRVTLALEEIPAAFPELNTGVIACRRSKGTDALLDRWLVEFDRLAPSQPLSMDQPSFRRALYESDVRLAILTPEFNMRFEMAGYHNDMVRVLHGRTDEKTYGRVAQAMNTDIGRPGDWQVISGCRVYRHGRLVADVKPRRMLRGLRAALLRHL
jgi:hypothetical protein